MPRRSAGLSFTNGSRAALPPGERGKAQHRGRATMEPQRNYKAPEAACRTNVAAGGSSTDFDGAKGREPANAGPSPVDAFKDAAGKLGEVKEYASLLVAAKLDSIKLTVRNIGVYAALGIVGGLVAIGMLITAGVMLMIGLAGLIGEIFPEKWERWGGPLVLGLIVVTAAVVGILLGLKYLTGSSRKRTIEKYENRKRDERLTYGHDASERAREQARREEQQAGA
jgi:hypothetical protein